MAEPVSSASLFALLVALGTAGAVTHCPGMCGPLMVAFRFGGSGSAGGSDGATGRPGWWPGVSALLAYQGGRALVYAGFGAAAGGGGQLVQEHLHQVGPWVLGAVAVAMLLIALPGLVGGILGRPVPVVAVPAVLVRAVTRWSAGRSTAVGLGMAMAFLPCGVVVQALLLALASGSALVGSGLLVLLVVITTPTLLACHLVGRGGGTWFGRLLGNGQARFAWLPSVLLLLGAGWLGWIAWQAATTTDGACVVPG